MIQLVPVIALILLGSGLAIAYVIGGAAAADMPHLLLTIIHSLPAIALPVIILGGIVFGLTTPTEAAAVAVFAALLAGWFYEGLTWPSVLEGLQRTAKLSGSIFIIISAVSALVIWAHWNGSPRRFRIWSRRWGWGRTSICWC